MAALEVTPNLAARTEPAIPAVPQTLEETGIAQSTVEHLIFKFLYFRGELSGRELSNSLGLKFSVIDPILEGLKLQHLVHVKRSAGFGNVSAQLVLTEEGRARARECLDFNQYMGPVPVPLDQYTAFVRRQKAPEGWLTPEALGTAYRNMVMSPRVLALLGPAVSAGTSFLVYGMPGDGKTYMAENLANLQAAHIYLPYAIECQGNIVQVFDPVYHVRIDESQSASAVFNDAVADGRWAKCKRPFIMTGGELTLEMLDLSYNPTSKVYDAPFQLKANNGIYLIDDFGRQRATPAEVLNRWIVPMERRTDYLSFRSGGKMTVPFEAFLVFSTNLNPAQLGDEAFLRRIQYKMHLHGPSEPEFIDIFRRFCSGKGLACPDGMVERFIARRYRPNAKPFRRCHPRDVLSHAIDMIQFHNMPFVLTDELLDHAFESCFVEESEADAHAAEPWQPAAPAPSLQPATPARVAAAPAPAPVTAAANQKPPAAATTPAPTPAGSWKHTLMGIRSTFGKLLYFSSLRDPDTGKYSEPSLLAEVGPQEADKVLRAGHVQTFGDWLSCTLGNQKSDIERYLAALNESKSAALRAWLRGRAYMDLIPQPVSEQDRRLYSADMESLMEMLSLKA